MRKRYALLLVLVVAGCANLPYALTPIEVKEEAPGRFNLTVMGNAYTQYEVLDDYFMRKASELCGGKRFTHNSQHTTNTFVNSAMPYFRHTHMWVVGTVACEK